MSQGIKISALPDYAGPAQPAGKIPVSIGGVTYGISPAQISPAGPGSGSMNHLDEFEAGAEGSPMNGGDTNYTPVSDDDKAKFAAATGVKVFAGGTLLPNIIMSTGGRRVGFVTGNNFATIYGGVTDGEHIEIMTY